MLTRNRVRAIERVFKIRIRNLQALVTWYGNQSRLATAMGVTPSFIGQLCGPNPKRTIGEKLARDIEVRCGLVQGWLDQEKH